MGSNFYITSSPHVHDGDSVSKIMWNVVAALVPAAVWGVYLFGLSALSVILWTVGASVAFEAVAQKVRGHAVTVTDGSAVLTGLLLAMNLPASSPWWLAVFGGGVAIFLGKQVFGGLGQNPYNPAMVARVILLISFPVQMTDWAVTGGALSGTLGADAVSAATPLGEAKTFLQYGKGAMPDVSVMQMLLGYKKGCLGEGGALLLLLGAAWLFYKKIITWDIPAGFIGATFFVTGLAWAAGANGEVNPYLDPLTHLLTGGLVLGAFYMATDMVTSPLNAKGRLVFGIGCGLLTGIIRLWGGYPEGVSFSILLMNSCVPLIDKWTKPRKFGYVAPAKEGAA